METSAEKRRRWNRENRERNGAKFNATRRKKYADDAEHRSVLTARAKEARPKHAAKVRIYMQAYVVAHKDELAAKAKVRRAANSDRDQALQKKWKAKNAERHKAGIAAWRLAHPDYRTKRYAEDPEFLITHRLRSRLGTAVKRAGTTKVGRFLDLLGCDVPTLRAHIEGQFLPGMTWANYPLWHVDHIRPCVTFDLTNAEQQRACFHFINLRPLWAGDNLARQRSRWVTSM